MHGDARARVGQNGGMTAHDLARDLPAVPEVRDRCRAFAMLDAIIGYGSRFPVYTFDAAWSPGAEVASWRNGAGDEWDVVFTAGGAWIRGFDHESPMSPYQDDDLALWPGLVEDVPEVFAPLVTEPAFGSEDGPAATVCVWWAPGDDRWRAGDIAFPPDEPDGADWMFGTLLDPGAYHAWAENYWGVTLDGAAVDAVLALRPLTAEMVRGLHPEASVAGLAEQVAPIGYPISPNGDAV